MASAIRSREAAPRARVAAIVNASHRIARTLRLSVAVASLFVAACSSGSGTPSPSPTAAPPLVANPTSVSFSIADDIGSPQAVDITSAAGFGSGLTVSVGDPTQLGAAVALPNQPTMATLSIYPISSGLSGGSSGVSLGDSLGGTAMISVTQEACGRPASLVDAQQAYPANASTGVSTNVGKLYFVAYFYHGAPTSGRLHLTVGSHGTLEGGPLVAATLPPGTLLPTPIPLPDTSDTIVSATVPTLLPGQQYRTQLYNDTCQSPIIAGSFST